MQLVCQLNVFYHQIIIFSISDGSDHVLCCQNSGVPRDCLHWCAGYQVEKPSICLLSSLRQVLSCFKEGNKFLPSAPTHIRIKEFNNNKNVIITWNPPLKNSENVQWYTIIWKEFGKNEFQSDRTDKLYYEITNLNPNQIYEVFIKASNYQGSSTLTDPIVINFKFVLMNEGSGHFLKYFFNVLIGLAILISLVLIAGIFIYYSCNNQNLLNKLRLNGQNAQNEFGVSFENQGYVNDLDRVQLRDSLSHELNNFNNNNNNNNNNDNNNNNNNNNNNVDLNSNNILNNNSRTT